MNLHKLQLSCQITNLRTSSYDKRAARISTRNHLGHTKLILCFTDCLGQKHDPVGRQKNKNKNDRTSHEFN